VAARAVASVEAIPVAASADSAAAIRVVAEHRATGDETWNVN
jgi:hypothetical protein